MKNVKFLVVTCGWNCEKWVEACFKSIKDQTYTNFNVIAFDDASTDDTFEKMNEFKGDNFVLIKSDKNVGGYFSYREAILRGKELFEFDVIIFVALDDKFYPTALELTAKEYEKGMIHTYSAYINNDGFIYKDLFYPEEITKNRDYRKDKYRCTGVMSIKKEMYFAIPELEQCEIEKNIYYNVETAMSFLEMAGPDRIGIITEPIYHYNNSRLDNTANRFGRNMEVYKKIMNRPKRNLL